MTRQKRRSIASAILLWGFIFTAVAFKHVRASQHQEAVSATAK